MSNCISCVYKMLLLFFFKSTCLLNSHKKAFPTRCWQCVWSCFGWIFPRGREVCDELDLSYLWDLTRLQVVVLVTCFLNSYSLRNHLETIVSV